MAPSRDASSNSRAQEQQQQQQVEMSSLLSYSRRYRQGEDLMCSVIVAAGA
jgi:hypothetical protein